MRATTSADAALLTQRLRTLQALLDQRTEGAGLQPGANSIVAPLPAARRDRLLATLELDRIAGAAAFYALCNGVSLPDLAGGRFIHGLQMIERGLAAGQPQSVVAPITCSVLVFGSDGGGGLYAFDLDHDNAVLHLPAGRVVDATYDDAEADVRTVAPDLSGFLELLCREVEASGSQRPTDED